MRIFPPLCYEFVMLERVRGREALILACCIWAFHALLEMSIAESFLLIALVWAAHGLVFMLIMGALLDRALGIASQPLRMTACALLALGFTLIQTTTDLYVTLTFGTGLLEDLQTPPGMVFDASNLEFQIAYKLNFKYYIWLFGFYTAILALLSETRDKWRARLDVQRAEMDALRLQVNPHFLFNALNAMDGLLTSRRTAAARDMLRSLSDFYRSSLLDRDDALISLEEEFAIVAEYVSIEQARFGDRLQARFELGEGDAAVSVPPLILQPLVENAVKYGVASTVGKAVVIVRSYSEGGACVIEVISPLGSSTPGGAGIGLSNVRARLKAGLGDRATLEAGARDGGWAATIRIPRAPESAQG